MMMLAALLSFATLAVAAPVPLGSNGLVARAECPPLQVTWIPGTGEDGLEDTGEAFKKSMLEAVPDATVTPLDYDTSKEYFLTPFTGAAKLSLEIASKAKDCPDSSFAIAGYSKGAMVLHEAILTPKIKEKIVALVVFGDPFTADTGLASQLTGGLTGDLSDVWPVNNPGENTKSFCHPEDPICGGGNDEKAHGTYDDDGSTTEGAKFIAGRYAA